MSKARKSNDLQEIDACRHPFAQRPRDPRSAPERQGKRKRERERERESRESAKKEREEEREREEE